MCERQRQREKEREREKEGGDFKILSIFVSKREIGENITWIEIRKDHIHMPSARG